MFRRRQALVRSSHCQLRAYEGYEFRQGYRLRQGSVCFDIDYNFMVRNHTFECTRQSPKKGCSSVKFISGGILFTSEYWGDIVYYDNG